MEEAEEGVNILISKFKKADKDKDGLISFQELAALMNKCKFECSEAELQDYVNDVEINEEGQLDCNAFLSIVEKYQEEKDSQQELDKVFDIFNKNKTGLISPKDVLEIFRKIDETIKEEEIFQMFKECDLDKDGYLNREEFTRMIKNK